MRLNPITYGLRARDVILPSEDPAEYRQLWADLEAEWQPETRTERLHLEQMAIAQWLLARLAKGESRIYEAALPLEKQLGLLDRVSTQRVCLEHSFRDAMRELKQLQRERKAQQQRQQPKQTVQAAKPDIPIPVNNPPPLIFDNRTPRHNGYATPGPGAPSARPHHPTHITPHPL